MSGVGGVVVAAKLIEATVVGAGNTGGVNASPFVVNGVGTCPMFSIDSGTQKKQKTKSRELEQCKGIFRKGNFRKGNFRKGNSECERDSVGSAVWHAKRERKI